MRKSTSALFTVLALWLCDISSADQWPRFRGPGGAGVSTLKGVPATWNESDFEWKVELPGIGHSSPVIWDDKLFLTTGTEDGTRTLRGFNALTGKELWHQSINLGTNKLHKKNSYASGSAAADAERVYISHADTGENLVIAYTHDGQEVWRYKVGSFAGQHGQGISPIVYNGLLIVPNDQDGPSSIVALNAKTGDVVWTADRPSREVSYSTPFIHDVGGNPQLICLSGITGLAALDPRNGQTIWSGAPLAQRTVGSPVSAGGRIFAVCGQGGRGTLMMGVDPTAPNAEPILVKKGIPYVPTPIGKGDRLFLWTDDGFAACLDVKTQKELWRSRVGGNYTASPILIDDKIYAVGEDGQVAVVAAEDEYKLYGKSPIGDNSFATPAVANGRVYFRGFHSLVSLKAK